MSKLLSMLMMRKKIPSIYKVLDWIQSTGTQYIDTGYTPNPNTEIDTKLRVINWNTQSFSAVFGCRTSNHSTDSFLICRQVENDDCRFEIDGSYIYQIDALTRNTDCTISITATNFSCNGTNYTIDMSKIVPNNLSLFLFGLNQNGSLEISYGSAYSRFYYFKAQENGATKLNLIPVRRTTDNVLGMYDTVSKTFFTNAGTGSFIGSDEFPLTVVGSPTITDGVVSGFSNSNYLDNPYFKFNNNFSLKIKFKTFSDDTRHYICSYANGGIFRLIKFTDNKLLINIGTAHNSFDIGELKGTTIIQNYVDYYALFSFDGSVYKLFLSTDDINYNLEGSLESNTIIKNGDTFQLNFGCGNAFYLDGSIDLNYTYMILDGTKYIFTV